MCSTTFVRQLLHQHQSKRLIDQAIDQLDAEEVEADEWVPESVESNDAPQDILDLESIASDEEEEDPELQVE